MLDDDDTSEVVRRAYLGQYESAAVSAPNLKGMLSFIVALFTGMFG